MSLPPTKKIKDLHRVRFITHTPLAIKDLKYNEKNSLILCSRENGIISLLDAKNSFIPRSLFFAEDGDSVSSLCWHPDGEYFFSAGNDGMITIWSTSHHNSLRSFNSYGSAVNSMVCLSDGSVLAVGCDDGTVRFFLIDQENLIYQGSSEAFSGAVVSLAAHPSGRIVVAGTAGGQAVIIDITAKPFKNLAHCFIGGSKRQPAIAWTVSFIDEASFVVGTSRGTILFFKIDGSKLGEFKKHNADILCTTVVGKKVYASGMDPVVAEFRAGNEPIFTSKIRTTTHDFTAMCACNVSIEYKVSQKKKTKRSIDVLLCGGIDGHFAFYKTQDFNTVHKSFLKAGNVHCLPSAPIDSQGSKIITARGADFVELWDLSPQNAELPKCAMRMKSDAFKQLLGLALSQKGFFAASTSLGTRIYNFNENSQISRISVDIENSMLPPCSVVKFITLHDSELFLGATVDGVVFIAAEQDFCFKIKMAAKATENMPVHLSMSSDGLYIAVTDSAGKVTILSSDLEGALPASQQISNEANQQVTATVFKDHQLFVCTNNFELREFDVEKSNFVESDKIFTIENLPSEIFGDFANPPFDLTFSDDKNLVFVSAKKIFSMEIDEKIYKKLKISRENILGIFPIDDENVILIENTSIAQKQLLPPSIYTHKHGSA